MNTFIEENIKINFGEQADRIIREIKLELWFKKQLGKNAFTNSEIGSGWLTKKKNGQIIFTPKINK